MAHYDDIEEFDSDLKGAGLRIGMVGPMSTIGMGVLILGEPFNGWIVVGTVLVMSGVFLVTRFAGK